MKSGISIKPKTPVDLLFPLLDSSRDKVDLILIMSVEPGFGGQDFMPETMDKVQELRSRYPDLNIQVDGGISPSTIDQASRAGANVIVAGSAIFGSKDPKETISNLRKSVQNALEGQ